MKCDIVLLVWNELQLTKDCLESFFRHTHYPHRLILVDNGSEQETAEYLKGLKEKKDTEILLIRNEKNAGFVKAINQGMKASDAPYVCLLSNDILLGDNWLAEMIAVAESNAQIGIVNPSSNTLGQILKEDSVDSYAKSLKDFKGQWQELGRCEGFCMLIKREVIDKIGFLDEIFSPYFFEESDFCRRTQEAGFKCVRAKATYVYHEGSATLKKRPHEKEQIYKKNYDIFCRRWGKPLKIAYVASGRSKIKQDRINKIALLAAKDNHQIWIFLKKSQRISYDFDGQSNVRFFWLSDYFYNILSICKMLKKTPKKSPNIIISDNRILSGIFKKLKFYHKADVLFEPSLEKARQLWKQKSVYP